MKKCSLRELTLNDTKDFFECLHNPDLKGIFAGLYTNSEDEARIILNLFIDEHRRKERRSYGISIPGKEKDKIIGMISSKRVNNTADLICLLNPDYQGKGYASAGLQEAMKKIKRQEKGIQSFRMLIADQNEKTKNLAIRLGFQDKGKNEEIPSLTDYELEAKKHKREIQKGER